VILKVPVHLIDGIWPSIESYVIRTCDYHPFMEAPDVLELLKNEMGVLFISVEGNDVVGFGVLEVVKYPRRTVANIRGAGGSSGFLAVAIDDLLPVMIEHGKTQGATVVAYSGRPGWLRKLHRYGGESKRYITWWADIDEQGRRKFSAPDNHARAVEASAAIPD
jgi:hypothetical protein